MNLYSLLNEYNPKVKITSVTELVADLGIDGDTADELFEDISKKLRIDLDKFKLERFFHAEEELIDTWYGFKWIAYKIHLTKKLPLRELESFNVADLEALINDLTGINE